jgi:hypothetical protein
MACLAFTCGSLVLKALDVHGPRQPAPNRSATLPFVIPPLRYSSVGMTKGRAAFSFRFDAADDEQQVPPLRYAPVGMTLLLGTDKRSS